MLHQLVARDIELGDDLRGQGVLEHEFGRKNLLADDFDARESGPADRAEIVVLDQGAGERRRVPAAQAEIRVLGDALQLLG